MSKRAVFLDRDGVLNYLVPHQGILTAPWNLSEFKLIENTEDFVKRLKTLGFLIVVVTNQPDVAKGKLTLADLNCMHQLLKEHLKNLDGVEACTSDDDSNPRRKPNPGMLLDAAKEYGIDLEHSFMVGDRDKDIEAGKRAGVTTILLETDYNQKFHGMADYNCLSYDEIVRVIERGAS